MDKFESLEDEVCEHLFTKPVLQRRGSFFFTADTCTLCGDFHWREDHENAFRQYCVAAKRHIKYKIPKAVDLYMSSHGIPDMVALKYFLNLWVDDSDILDFIDNEYAPLYEANDWGSSKATTSKEILLEPDQFGCVTDLCDECGFSQDVMVGDVIARTIATAMYLRPGEAYKRHRRDLMNRQKAWWR